MFQFLKIGLLMGLLLAATILYGQNTKEKAVDNLLENWIDDIEEGADYDLLTQELYALYDNPINVNEADVERLQALPMLSDIVIANLLNYRKRVGRIYTIYELSTVAGFTPQLLQDLQYFITFEKSKNEESLKLVDILRYSSNSLLLRGQRNLEQRYGYKELQLTHFKNRGQYEAWQKRRYRGNPWWYYLRYDTHYKTKFSAGFVAEKDAGEEFFSGTQKRGFDHYTGFVQVNDIGILKTAIVGDYLPQFGQGLVSWGGYNIGKSAYFTHVNKRNEGLKKYSSTNENKYFRGIAATVAPSKKIRITAYYSNKRIDGNLQENKDSGGEEQCFTSFLNSGYHRSFNELENRKTVGEQIVGANTTFRYKNLNLGANAINYQFSKSFEKSGNSLRDLYAFSGNHGQNYSLYGSYRYHRLLFFGEAALDKENDKAFLGGALFSADERLQFSLLYRDYSKAYQALYASGFGDKAGTKNERGWYLGMEMLPWAKWKLSAYFDNYEFPWLRVGANAPARGYDYKIRLEYTHSPKLNAYLQFYQEENQRNTSEATSKIRFLTTEKRTKLRAHIEYEVTPNLQFKNRVSLSFYKKEAEDYKGFLLYHDVVYSSDTLPLSLTARYALFDIEDYDARIYAYENDVLYAFSNAMFQNRGFRCYLNAKWQLNTHFTLWAKYSITKYADKKTISSGMNLIDCNHIQELKMQLRYKF